jgi:hypothetical protein
MSRQSLHIPIFLFSKTGKTTHNTIQLFFPISAKKMSTEENTATHTRKTEAKDEAEDQPESKKTKLSVEEESEEKAPETPVKPKSKAGRPPVKKAATAPGPETDKQIVAAGTKDKKKPAPAPATQKKKTAPADSDDEDEETDGGEQDTKKKRKSSKSSKPVREIIPHARLHSITGKIIEKNRPGLRIGDDFLVRLSEKLNHYVTDFIKASHLCSTFKGLKTTNGNAIALTGELISFVRRNPHLLFELKPPSEITYVSPSQKTRQPLMLTY